MTRDLRRYARQTSVRLAVGAVLILLLVGDGLIYLIYGPAAAVSGLLCILAGLAPIVLVIIALAILDWVARRANPD